MATPVSNSAPASAPQQTDTAVSSAPVSSGISSVASSISSAAERQSESSFSCIFKPFISAWNAIQKYINSFFPMHNFKGDLVDYAVTPDDKTLQNCMDQFVHFKGEHRKWQAFQCVQNDLDADKVKMFYDLLPSDMQVHLKRHIWEINGNDNDMGIFFGDAVIRDDIKGDLVKKAIAQCLSEV